MTCPFNANKDCNQTCPLHAKTGACAFAIIAHQNMVLTNELADVKKSLDSLQFEIRKLNR